jgi:Fe-S oxidoreductase
MTVHEIKFRDNVVDTTEYCRYCLMCRHVCPVGHITKNETLTPHGWGLTVASVRRGQMEWNTETIDVMYQCADCGSCNAHCVTDQPLPDAIAAARAEIVAQGLAPGVVSRLDEALRQWGNPFEPQPPATPSGTGEIALFVGDEARYQWPGVVDAALKLLAAAGIEPVLIGVGRSNGYLPASLGLPDTATRLIGDTFAELRASGAATMLVLSPGDYYAFQRMQVERLNLGWPDGVVLQEVTTVLDGALDAGALTLKRTVHPQPYAYIDPMHTIRVPERVTAPRRLLAATHTEPAHELFWRQDRAHPTGASALQFTNPALATALTHARLQDAAAVGAHQLFTEAAGDLYHLSHHASHVGVQVISLYEYLVEHLI